MSTHSPASLLACACLADGLTPRERHEVLMDTFARVSGEMSVMDGVRARREVIEAIAGEVAIFYNQWDRENPEELDWSNPTGNMPKDEHPLVRATLAFATASPAECDWLVYCIKQKTHPEYCCDSKVPGADISSGLEFKLQVMSSQAQNFLGAEDLPAPSSVFSSSVVRGLQYDNYPGGLTRKDGLLGQGIDVMFQWAAEGAWDKVEEALGKTRVGSQTFSGYLEKLKGLPKEDRNWVGLTNEFLFTLEHFWPNMVGLFRYCQGPQGDLRQTMIDQCCKKALDAYDPNDPALLEAFLRWQGTMTTALAEFVPRSQATHQAWSAVAPLMEREGFDVVRLRELLCVFNEEEAYLGKRPKGETEEGYRAWEARRLRERLDVTLDHPAVVPLRRRTL